MSDARSGRSEPDDPNPLVREVYEALGDLLAEGDDAFVEEGPDLLAGAIEEPAFFEGVETEQYEHPTEAL